MQEAGFFIGFFILLIVLAFAGADGDGFFSSEAKRTSTPNSETIQEQEETTPTISAPQNTTRPASTPKPTKRLTNAEIEKKLARLYRELDSLEDDLREFRLNSPLSPHSGTVELRIGNARSTDPEREYLMLYARSNNDTSVNISDWYIESYVTEEVAALPEGTRILESRFSKTTEPIRLEPGERAYVITGDNPLNVSFHENQCTGYLRSNSFYPSLSRSCPRPLDELEEFGRVDYDNDACYELVEDIARCEIVDDREIEERDVSRACEVFIDEYLNYNACVENHRYEPFFDNVGYWRIYLNRDRREEEDDDEIDGDLWRKEREILRLMDENDRVVDVLEY